MFKYLLKKNPQMTFTGLQIPHGPSGDWGFGIELIRRFRRDVFLQRKAVVNFQCICFYVFAFILAYLIFTTSCYPHLRLPRIRLPLSCGN